MTFKIIMIKFKILTLTSLVSLSSFASKTNDDGFGATNFYRNNHSLFQSPMDHDITRIDYFEETHDTYGDENFVLNPPKTRKLFIPPYEIIEDEALAAITGINELVLYNQPLLTNECLLTVVKNNALNKLTIVGPWKRIDDLISKIPFSTELAVYDCYHLTDVMLNVHKSQRKLYLKQQFERQEQIKRKKSRSDSF